MSNTYLVDSNASKEDVTNALKNANVEAEVQQHGEDVIVFSVHPEEIPVSEGCEPVTMQELKDDYEDLKEMFMDTMTAAFSEDEEESGVDEADLE